MGLKRGLYICMNADGSLYVDKNRSLWAARIGADKVFTKDRWLIMVNVKCPSPAPNPEDDPHIFSIVKPALPSPLQLREMGIIPPAVIIEGSYMKLGKKVFAILNNQMFSDEDNRIWRHLPVYDTPLSILKEIGQVWKDA